MAVSATWNTGDGNWFDAGNWNEPNDNPPPPFVNYVPNADNDAYFNGTTAYTVTYDGTDAIAGIGGDDGLVTLDMTGGTLTVGPDNGALYELETAVGATFAIDDSLAYSSAGTYRITDAIDNAGTIQLNSVGHHVGLTIGLQTTLTPVTLSGGGAITMSDSAENEIFIDNDASLDNVDNTISGAGVISANFTSLTNEAKGVIDANYADNGLILSIPTITNSGLLEATGAGGLQLGASFGSGTVDNVGGMIEANGAGAVVDIQFGEDIESGTLSTSNGGVIEIVNSGQFDGETDGALTIAAGAKVQVNDGASLNLSGAASHGGGIVNEGEIDVDGATATTKINFNEGSTSNPLTLSGGGAIKLSDSAFNQLGLGNSTILDNVDNTISGAGGIGANFTTLINEAKGTIDATGTNNALVLTVPSVTNKGLLEDTGTAGLSLFTGAGSAAVDNQGGTIAANGAGAHVDLGGGASVAGGTLSTSGGGVIEIANSAYGSVLDGSSDGALTIAKGATVQVNDGAVLGFTGTSATPGVVFNDGTIALDAGADQTKMDGRGGGAVKFEGGGSITLTDSANNAIAGGDLGTVFENVDNTLSGAGVIYATLNNDAGGVIDATGAANALVLEDAYFTNAGLMEGTGAAGLQFADTTVTNAGGVISASGAGAHVDFSSHYGGNTTVVGGSLETSNGGVVNVMATLCLQGAVTVSAAVQGAGVLDVNNGATTISSGSTLAVGTLTTEGGATTEIATSINYGGAFYDKGTVQIDGSSTLELSGTVSFNGAINFASGGAGTLTLDASALANGQTFADTVGDFSAGDVIDLSGLTFATNVTPTYDSSSGTLTVTEGGVTDTLVLTAPGATNFTLQADKSGGTEIVVCFASGTHIRTERGDVAVERLAIGDQVMTASGERRAIRWIGHRNIERGRRAVTYDMMPVRICAHAFGENRPTRDLFVSPGHSICVDILGEVLIPAIALVNGATIQQVEVDQITYWHVELDSHDLLLAENLAAESYLDMGNRGFFREAGVVDWNGAPDTRTSPVRHSDFCRPYHDGGPIVEAVRAQLHRRAVGLGWTLSQALEMHLEIDGRRLLPVIDGLTASFALPASAGDARLVSPTARPRQTTNAYDFRDLGLCVGAMSISGGLQGSQAIALDDPRLGEGFHDIEDGVRRWTHATAKLPASLWRERRQDFTLTIAFAGEPAPRWVAPDGCGAARRAA